MHLLLAILLFPILWVVYFALRLVIFDILLRLILLIRNLFVAPFSIFYSLLALPFYLLLDIILGLVFSFLSARNTCKRIYRKRNKIPATIADGFAEYKNQSFWGESHNEN